MLHAIALRRDYPRGHAVKLGPSPRLPSDETKSEGGSAPAHAGRPPIGAEVPCEDFWRIPTSDDHVEA